ncbi:hypothetical protein [Tenacibaculum geojense]|uniref:Lipocalin-like domain-containing protein n=1 Tax=Tenacibaculum geojense TaxID=915352 RepID=A0ABW3JS42_9FLAO
MKKHLFLLCIVSMLSSCSSDENELENPIIGTWQQIDLIINNQSSDSECIEKNTITFNSDFSLRWLRHTQPNCNLDDGGYTGTWEKIDDTNYSLRTDENFILTKNGNEISIQESNNNSRTWIFKK